jgi:predicted NUDIX family NTP pyrophosphohydrolase
MPGGLGADRSVVRYGVGPHARRAANRRADEVWASGVPARAYFALELGGWVTVIYEPFPDTHVIRAGGAVLWRAASGRLEVALVHRPKYGDWSLPKGKLAADEHPLFGAYREMVEETGARPIVGWRLPSRRYATRRGPKVVEYWAMRADAGQFAPSEEVDRAEWLAPAEALHRLSYAEDEDVLESLGVPREASAVVLITGTEQADPPDRTLRLFGVRRVARAAIEPRQVLKQVRELAEVAETWAVSGAASVIHEAVVTLAAEDGHPVPDAAATATPQLWALFFVAGRLAGADRYADLL